MTEKDLVCTNCLFYAGEENGSTVCAMSMEDFIENDRCGALALNLAQVNIFDVIVKMQELKQS